MYVSLLKGFYDWFDTFDDVANSPNCGPKSPSHNNMGRIHHNSRHYKVDRIHLVVGPNSPGRIHRGPNSPVPMLIMGVTSTLSPIT